MDKSALTEEKKSVYIAIDIQDVHSEQPKEELEDQEIGWQTEDVQDSVDFDGVRKDIKGQGLNRNLNYNLPDGEPLAASKRGSTEYMRSHESIQTIQIQSPQHTEREIDDFKNRNNMSPLYTIDGLIRKSDQPGIGTINNYQKDALAPGTNQNIFSPDFSESAVEHSEIQLVDNFNKFGQNE